MAENVHTSCSSRTSANVGDNECSYVKQFHDDAYTCLDEALTLEERGRTSEAVVLYERGLRQLEQGLSVSSAGPNCTGERWDTVRLNQMKMRKMKEQVMERLSELSKERAASASASAAHLIAMQDTSSETMTTLPSYEEACQNVDGGTVNGVSSGKTYGELSQMLEPMELGDLPSYSEVPTDATEIFCIPDGVQIFFVSADGTVSAPSYPTALSIFKFTDSAAKSSKAAAASNQPPAFLQVGEWIYPLFPGTLPVLHSSYGAYLFPDTNSTDPGAVIKGRPSEPPSFRSDARLQSFTNNTRAAIGLLLSENIPVAIRELFEHLMCELTALHSQLKTPPSGERRFSTKLSDGIVSGAEMVSKGVAIGAEKTNQLVHLAAAKLRARMSHNETPTPIDPRVQKGMKVAKDVTGVAVQVSGYIITQLGRGTFALGQYLAPHVRRQGSRLLSKCMKEEDVKKGKADDTIDSILEVASGGLRGFSAVYLGLETAAKALAENLVNETVTTVQYRYGNEASATTGNALYAAGNLATTAYNVNNLGVRAVVKRTAKDTGRALVKEYEKSKEEKPN